MSSGTKAGILVGVMAGIFGCDGGTTSEPFVVRDSAGVTIVESTTSLWDEGEGWTARAEPEIVIGRAEGDERYVLDQVLGARRFSDGRIAILDVGSSRVRVYDADGHHLFDAGGPGQGPGEFSDPQYLHLIADTIVVYQNGPPTLSWFDDRGRLIRSVRLTGITTRPLFGNGFGILAGEALVMAAHPRDRPVREPGPGRESMSLWRLALDASRADSLMHLDADEIVVDTDGSWSDLTFGNTTYYAASRDRVYVGATDAYSIHVLNPAGVLERVIRRVVKPRRVTDADIERAAEQAVAAAYREPEMVPVIARRIREVGTAEFMPAFRMLVADADDNLWVEDWDDVGNNQGAFSVFRPDGVWLGRVHLPAGLPWFRAVTLWTSILEIGTDYVLGVWLGELGVEEVRMYRIDKPSVVQHWSRAGSARVVLWPARNAS